MRVNRGAPIRVVSGAFYSPSDRIDDRGIVSANHQQVKLHCRVDRIGLAVDLTRSELRQQLVGRRFFIERVL